MLRKALTYGAVLIGVYLGVTYATGAGTDIRAVDSFTTDTVKTLQGR